jgi:hypothetical protein
MPGVGSNRPTAILIRRKLILNADATYTCTVNSKFLIANKVVAKGVAINGAQFILSDTGSEILAPGTVFTAISNSAATPIAGTFTNLADGSSITVGNNTFQANYEGGDGNDLTLTVQ